MRRLDVIAIAHWMLPAVRFVVLAVLASVVGVRAEDAGPRLTFQATSESRIRLTGATNLGQWDSETDGILAVIEPGRQLEALARLVSAGINAAGSNGCAGEPVDLRAVAPPHALITIPVESLRFHQPGMRSQVRRTLRMDDAPLIVFLLAAVTGVEVQPRSGQELGRYRVIASGDLSLAGQSRRIEIAANVVQEASNRFRVRAAHTLRMTEFGITPPTAVFGLIRADDAVRVEFDLMFEKVSNP